MDVYRKHVKKIGGRSCRPILVITKFTPQIAEINTAKNMCIGFTVTLPYVLLSPFATAFTNFDETNSLNILTSPFF